MRGARPLTVVEVEDVKKAFGGKMAVRNRALFAFGINTGFRIAELLSLRLGDVLEADGQIKNRVTVSRRFMKGKRRSRSVSVNSKAKYGILPWLIVLKHSDVIHKDDFIFQSHGYLNKSIGYVQADRILKRAFSSVGLNGQLSTHTMRKTFANNVYNGFLRRVSKGEPVDAFRSTSKALGHADIKSTDQYLTFVTEEIDEMIEEVGV